MFDDAFHIIHGNFDFCQFLIGLGDYQVQFSPSAVYVLVEFSGLLHCLL